MKGVVEIRGENKTIEILRKKKNILRNEIETMVENGKTERGREVAK
jgi:hypothetical protein